MQYPAYSDWSDWIHPPTRSVLRWYRLRILTFCRAAKVPHEMETYVLDWYGDRFEQFLIFVPVEVYRGRGFAMGAWTIDAVAVKAAMAEASREVYGIILAEVSGPITEADVDAALARQAEPREPCADLLLPAQKLEAFTAKRQVRQADWPRLCVACGVEFRPHHRSRVRCPDCRATGKHSDQEGAK